MYRLVRETANDGSFYYSSLSGAASILPGEERPREPLSVQMMVSGDGLHIFVMQYPVRFVVSNVFRVSDDGMYLIPETSQVNPMDFHTYWFTADQSADNLFKLLATKNKSNSYDEPSLPSACLCHARRGRAHGRPTAGDDASGWLKCESSQLGCRDVDEQLTRPLSRCQLAEDPGAIDKGRHSGGIWCTELLEKSNETIGVYRIEVPFPEGMITITYKESKVDGMLLSVNVMD